MYCKRCKNDEFFKALAREGDETYYTWVCAICGYSEESDNKRKHIYVYGEK